MKKWCLKVILLFVMVLICGYPTRAEEITKSGIIYKINEENNTCGISGFNELQMSANVSIPETIVQNNKVYDVTWIGDYSFFECNKLESISLPSSITEIGYSAFSGCKSLRTISLQEGVQSIKMLVFNGCTSLERIYIPASVYLLEDSAFQFCDSLTEIKVAEGNTHYYDLDGVLFSKQGEREVLRRYPASRAADTFVLGKDTLCSGDNPFWNCQNLKSIVVDAENQWHSSVDGVLYDKSRTMLEVCPAGKTDKVEIPEGVECIARWAFWGSQASEVIIPDSVTEIVHWAFVDCKGIKKLSIGKGYEYEEYEHMDGGSLIEDISLCKSLQSIVVSPENETLVFDDGILYTKDRKKILICPGSVKNIDISSDVTDILDTAFVSASQLDSIRVSSENKVCKVVDGILYKNGTILMCPKSVKRATILGDVEVMEGAFNYCSPDLILVVEESSRILEYAKEHGIEYELKEAPNEEGKEDIKNNSETENPGTETPGTETPGTNKTLPTVGSELVVSGVKYIVIKSSASAKEVKYVEPINSGKKTQKVPDTVKIKGYKYKVTEIEEYAFAFSSKLQSVTIGKNVKKIGISAFLECKKLKKITIKSKVLKKVGKRAIKDINKKATIKVPKSQLKKYKKLFNSKTGYKKTMKIKK